MSLSTAFSRRDLDLIVEQSDPAEDVDYAINSSIVNRRGIYKDVYGTPKEREWSDYQLRCNYPIAMTVAPHLFNPDHAIIALKSADELLKSPLGMKTLDPGDAQYRGNYDNQNDSHDASVAKGLNYHNVCEVEPQSDCVINPLRFM